MARTAKNNATYFSHDANMRNDEKIRAVRRKFGHMGYAVWCFILETLTAKENFVMQYDELSKELFAADYDVSEIDFANIVEYLVHLNLLQLDGETLKCQNLIRRFEGLEELRAIRKKAAQARWQNNRKDMPNAQKSDANASESDANASESDANAQKSDANASESDANASESDANAQKSDANASESDAKKSKVNNSKGKDNKEENNKENIKRKTASVFQKPTITEVQDYINEKGYAPFVDAEKFWNFYEAKGWMIGKNHMKNWHAAVATWVKQNATNTHYATTTATNQLPPAAGDGGHGESEAHFRSRITADIARIVSGDRSADDDSLPWE